MFLRCDFFTVNDFLTQLANLRGRKSPTSGACTWIKGLRRLDHGYVPSCSLTCSSHTARFEKNTGYHPQTATVLQKAQHHSLSVQPTLPCNRRSRCWPHPSRSTPQPAWGIWRYSTNVYNRHRNGLSGCTLTVLERGPRRRQFG